MSTKQLPGDFAPDRARYGCITDGEGNLVGSFSISTAGHKQLSGEHSPDDSMYLCLTDGDGNLIFSSSSIGMYYYYLGF